MRAGRGSPGLRMVLSLGFALGACATVPRLPDDRDPALLAATHAEQAERLEREGQLRQALDEWKIALTIRPDDARAQEQRTQVEARIERAVADRVLRGHEALGRGDHPEARRQFLAALALDPANRAAFQALQTEVRPVQVLVHVVREGETLVMLAERYYGDRGRSEVIAEANRLPPSPRLVAGMSLRIPEIPGLPEPRPGGTYTELFPQEAVPDLTPEYLEALESLERGEYRVALADVDRLLTVAPQSPDGIDLKKAILYEMGKHEFDLGRYAESYRALTQLAGLAPDYEDAGTLLRTARSQLAQQHYTQGMSLFREERLAEAIAQWRRVLEYDPQHANARRAVEQAERLLKGLQERKTP